MEYLGDVVSHEGLKVDPKKIKSIMECPIPKTLKNIIRFLGLTCYYFKFVKNYGQIATSLTMLLKKEEFSWTQETIKSFEKLKEAMCTTLVLATPKFKKKNLYSRV